MTTGIKNSTTPMQLTMFMSIQKVKQTEITCVPDTQVAMGEERIAATPQKRHIKLIAFDWDSKCTCVSMYPKACLPMCLKYHIRSSC